MSGLLSKIRKRIAEHGTRPHIVVCPACGTVENMEDFEVLPIECMPCAKRELEHTDDDELPERVKLGESPF